LFAVLFRSGISLKDSERFMGASCGVLPQNN
jgi:hypothetical protein